MITDWSVRTGVTEKVGLGLGFERSALAQIRREHALPMEEVYKKIWWLPCRKNFKKTQSI